MLSFRLVKHFIWLHNALPLMKLSKLSRADVDSNNTYIKSKHVKWGIKTFCVCCSITGYLLNAEFFLGKMSDNEEKKAEDSKTYTMIMRLLKPFRGRNHILHCDNWFTSVKLFQALKEWLWDNQNKSERSLRCSPNEERRGVWVEKDSRNYPLCL